MEDLLSLAVALGNGVMLYIVAPFESFFIEGIHPSKRTFSYSFDCPGAVNNAGKVLHAKHKGVKVKMSWVPKLDAVTNKHTGLFTTCYSCTQLKIADSAKPIASPAESKADKRVAAIKAAVAKAQGK